MIAVEIFFFFFFKPNFKKFTGHVENFEKGSRLKDICFLHNLRCIYTGDLSQTKTQATATATVVTLAPWIVSIS